MEQEIAKQAIVESVLNALGMSAPISEYDWMLVGEVVNEIMASVEARRGQ